jgi:hypothetical protein
VLIVYGVLALIVFGIATVSQYVANGSKDPTATAMTTSAAAKNQRNR